MLFYIPIDYIIGVNPWFRPERSIAFRSFAFQGSPLPGLVLALNQTNMCSTRIISQLTDLEGSPSKNQSLPKNNPVTTSTGGHYTLIWGKHAKKNSGTFSPAWGGGALVPKPVGFAFMNKKPRCNPTSLLPPVIGEAYV